MSGLKWPLAIVTLIVAILLAASIVVVRDGEYVVLTTEDTAIRPVLGPGLHLRAPFVHNVHRFRMPAAEPAFENSLVVTPHYIQYLSDSEVQFAQEAAELKRRLGSARHVMLGFGATLDLSFQDTAHTIANIEKIVQRARANGLVVHISILSGFFHGWNDLREQAIREDVRNAQWFADGLIAPPDQLTDPLTVPRSVWITPSRYALPLRTTIERGVRSAGAHLARSMQRAPDTFVTISGDGEVEYSYERNFGAGAEGLRSQDVVYTDYSPFMIEEFRDSLKIKYAGDATPDSDDNKDGRTLNRDFGTDFETWSLKYYDHSGPLPYAEYVRLDEKLPRAGPNFIPGGFDAPRIPQPRDAFWIAWLRFREDAIANWVSDFATWITTSPDTSTGFTIPASRYYTHQIPAEFLFGRPDNVRLKTSASALRTAFIFPKGSSGITAFNTFNGWRYGRTTSDKLFSALAGSSGDWGVLEYNPSVPSSNDDSHFLTELRLLYAYRPHLIVPWAWSDSEDAKRYWIKDSSFERSLRRFIAEAGETPWFSLRSIARQQ
jgi:hypothetical protein